MIKKFFIASAFTLLILSSCNKDKEILNSLNDYNLSQQNKGYHFGDQIDIPKNVLDYSDAITIIYGDTESKNLTVDPNFFTLGDNDVTFNIKTKSGKFLQQDATINVFAKTIAKNISYEIINQYPHNIEYFTEGFEFYNNFIYESVGLEGKSKLVKYVLGSTSPSQEAIQPNNIFSEGMTILNNRIYQLTYQSKKGFIYDMNMNLLKEFHYPNILSEGWGMTNDGKNLIVSDGSKNIYFLNPENPSEVLRHISVASDKESFDQINELEYHDGFIYSNVWRKPIILKINPENGEVVASIDFSNIVKQNYKDVEDVLNGIAFKDENMLITGKNWNKIYEVALK